MIDEAKLQNLQEKAKNIRKSIVEMVYSAASGHPGGSLSITDVFTALYFNELNIDVNNPKDENRDLYNKYLEKAKALDNVYFLGRLGDYQYYDMDKAVLRALELFEEIKSA